MDEEYGTIVSVKTLNTLAGLNPRSIFAVLYRRCLTKDPRHPAAPDRVVSMAGAYILDVRSWLAKAETAGYCTSQWMSWDTDLSPKAWITVGQLNRLLSHRYRRDGRRILPRDALFVVYLMAVSYEDGRIPGSTPRIVGVTGLRGPTVSSLLGRMRREGLVVDNWLAEYLRRKPRKED